MSQSTPAHAEAAVAAERILPGYLGRWIAGVLRETHALPALVHHQDRIAVDVAALTAHLASEARWDGHLPPSDDDLPGMWSHADFTGGQTDV